MDIVDFVDIVVFVDIVDFVDIEDFANNFDLDFVVIVGLFDFLEDFLNFEDYL